MLCLRSLFGHSLPEFDSLANGASTRTQTKSLDLRSRVADLCRICYAEVSHTVDAVLPSTHWTAPGQTSSRYFLLVD